MSSGTVSAAEVEKFDRLASRWWDPHGPMKPLHRMNPTRIGWIEGLFAEFSRARPASWTSAAAPAWPPRRWRVTATRCWGSMPPARRSRRPGRTLTGLGLTLTYRCGLAEELLAEGARFPVITCLEVIEHVPDPAGVRPGSRQGCWNRGLLICPH